MNSTGAHRMAQRKTALLGSGDLVQDGGGFLGLEAVRSRPAFVGDAPLEVDHVEAIRPSSVGRLCCVLEVVYNGGERNLKMPDAGLGHFSPFEEVGRRGNKDFVLQVRRGLPGVRSVGFQDIDNEKRRPVLIGLVDLREGGNLPPEGWSGVTAEYQDHGLVSLEGRKPHPIFPVEGIERKVRGGVADLQTAGTCEHPELLEGHERKKRPGHLRDCQSEAGRRL